MEYKIQEKLSHGYIKQQRDFLKYIWDLDSVFENKVLTKKVSFHKGFKQFLYNLLHLITVFNHSLGFPPWLVKPLARLYNSTWDGASPLRKHLLHVSNQVGEVTGHTI